MANGNNPTQTIRTAVRQDSVTRKQSILQRLFGVWFDAFVYNQIWEDPRVDLEALRLDKDSRVLTISSGGCNALNYLLDNPESITAIDLNRNHIFLLNLKKAAAQTLPGHEEFFRFFGVGKCARAEELYKKHIRDALDSETRKFWESETLIGKIANGKRIRYFENGGLYEHSRNGYFLRFFHRLAKFHRCSPEKILEAKNPEEQLSIYEREIEPFFDSLFVNAVGRMPITLFGLGIPPQQYDELKKDLAEKKSVIDIYRERAKKLAVEYPIDENYFAWQGFGRKYDTDRCRALPEYLKAENFESLRRNSATLSTKIGSVTEEIRVSAQGTYNRFVFLDAQDWMNKESLNELWTVIAEKGGPESRVIFRTAGTKSPLTDALPKELSDRFKYDEAESRWLFERDRASIYGGFHLYVMNGGTSV